MCLALILGLRSARACRGREGIYHKQGTIRAHSRIFFLSTCVRYLKQLRFRYRSSTFLFCYAFLTDLASAFGLLEVLLLVII